MRYFEYFEKLAPKRILLRKRHSYYWNDITNYCNYFSHESFSVLEIGCGTGELLHEIKGNKKTGIDFSPSMIEIASGQFPEINFKVMEAEEINLDDKYDLIILSNLISYLDDVQKVFEQLHKVCHEHTKIIVTYFNHLWEPALKFGEALQLKTPSPPLNWLTPQDTNNLLMLSGFNCYRITSRMIFPVYIPVISYLLNNFLGKLPLIKLLSINVFSFAVPAQRIMNEDVKEKFSVSVIIPAKNESGNIENIVTRISKFGKWQEFIFVEGGSSDDTWRKIVEVKAKYENQYKIKIIKQPGKGKADAVRSGFSAAEGDILMILDADMSVTPDDLPKFYYAISTGKGDFINGCRLVYTKEKNAMRFLNMIGNKFFSVVFSWLLDQPVKDTLCGTKVLFRSDYEKMSASKNFSDNADPFGDFDLLFGAHQLNLKICEMPVRYYERTYGKTNISRVKHGWLLLKMCFVAARRIKFK